MKNKIIISLLLLISTSMVVFIFNQRDIRCIFIYNNKQFQKIIVDSTTIFVSKDTPKETLELLFNVLKKSKDNVREFWSGLSNEATIIYCHNEKVYSKYGMKGITALTRLGFYIILPRDGLHDEIISHELCHTELFIRLGKKWWVYYQKLPCWFDEGLALQFNNLGMYRKSAMDTVPRWPINKLRTIDRPRKFYQKDTKITLRHYLIAKKEIATWLSKHSKRDLSKIIDSLREKGQFYTKYH
jgi:hypothetical protein